MSGIDPVSYSLGDLPYVCLNCNLSFVNGYCVIDHLDKYCGNITIYKRVKNMMKTHENLSLHLLKCINQLNLELCKESFNDNNPDHVEDRKKSINFISVMAGESNILHLKTRLLSREMKLELQKTKEKNIKSNSSLELKKIKSMKASDRNSIIKKYESFITKEKRNPVVVLDDIQNKDTPTRNSSNFKVEPKSNKNVQFKAEALATFENNIKNPLLLVEGENTNPNSLIAYETTQPKIDPELVTLNEEKRKIKDIYFPIKEEIVKYEPGDYIIESDTILDPRISDSEIRLFLEPDLRWLIPKIQKLPEGTIIPKMAKLKKNRVPEKMFARKLKKLIAFSIDPNYNKKRRRKEIQRLATENQKVENRTCEYCFKVFHSRRARDHHVSHIHLKNYAYYFCKECGQALCSRQQLRLHLRTVHGNMEKKFKCQVCEKLFRTKSEASVHESLVHRNNQYSCEICGKTFKWKNGLKMHILRLHDKISFDCDECGKKFCAKTKLYYHKRQVHMGIYDFKCEECDVTFNCPFNYKVHMKNKHGETVQVARKIHSKV